VGAHLHEGALTDAGDPRVTVQRRWTSGADMAPPIEYETLYRNATTLPTKEFA
jgi:hypothetical protein